MLISTHLAKTAGTSFGKSLENHFGEYLRKDYDDLPFNTPVIQRNLRAIKDCLAGSFRAFNGVECIHGHFLPLKYLLVGTRKDVKFITWLRDPVERLASQYYYWQRTYKPNLPQPFRRRVTEENWSLERFCLSHELRNFYSQLFWGFPISRFNFIGITEHYEEDFRFFSENVLGVSLPTYRANTNEEMNESKIYITDLNLRKKIEAYHEKDMALYHRILEKRPYFNSTLRE
jgi:hypothetical protein